MFLQKYVNQIRVTVICYFSLFLALSLLASCQPANDARDSEPEVKLDVRQYQTQDSLLINRVDNASGDMEVLNILSEIQPDYANSFQSTLGSTLMPDDGRLSGDIQIEEAEGGQVLVESELDLDGKTFYEGTPLLIQTCTPFILLKFKLTVNGSTALVVRTIEVCPLNQ